jgi:hypothetical protein
LAVLFLSCFAFSQSQDTIIVDAESNVEEIFEDFFTEESESDLYSVIEDLLLNQIELNTADVEQLISIPFLDINSAQLIVKHREKFGKFLSVNELYSISELNTDIIKKIIPFLKVERGITISDEQQTIENDDWLHQHIRKMSIKIRSRIGSDLQTRDGFIKGVYLGSKYKSYNRVILKYSSKIQAGITTEKDAGERYLNDFYSFHFSLNNYDFIKQFIIGDYNLEFAQGLILWSSYSFSKGSDAVLPIKKKSKILRPYTSATEYNFFRGSAALLNLQDFNFLFFYSSKKIDANIDSITQEIKSLPITGIHSTKTELDRKNRATETSFGSRLEYSLNSNNKFGVSFYKTNFSNPFQKNSIHDIPGKEFTLYSFDFDNRFGAFNIFGEVANDLNITAFYGGFILSPTSKLQFVSSVRKYPAGFKNLHSFGFGEQSGKTQNEFGIYSGFKFNSEFGLFNIYYDKFKFPYSTFENPVPSNGDEFYLSFRRKLSKTLELHLRFKTENKEVSEKIGNVKSIAERTRNSYRAEFDYYLNKQLKLRTRMEYNTYGIKKINLFERGFLVYEDIKFSPSKNLIMYGRIILFNTDSFNSAVYEYENDLTGLFTNLAMYGEGVRYYLIIKYNLFKNFAISFKYAETYKPNEKFLSSGNNRINGNVDNRFNFQIDVSL